MSGKARKYCLAAGCHNNDKNSKRTFFALPSGQTKEDDERCRKWLTILGRKDLLENERLRKRSYTVCCAHFDDSQIRIAKSLVKGSIPTLLLANRNGLSSVKSKNVEVEVPTIVPENADRTAVLSKTIKTEPIVTEDKIEVPATLSSGNVENTSVKRLYESENITLKSEPISIEQDAEVPAFLLSESGENTSISNKAVINAEIEQDADVPAILSTETSVPNISVKNGLIDVFPAMITSDIAINIPILNRTVKSEPGLVEQEIAVPATVSWEGAENTSASNIANLNSDPMPFELEKSTQTRSFLMKRKLSDERKKKRKKQNVL